MCSIRVDIVMYVLLGYLNGYVIAGKSALYDMYA